MSTSLYEYDTDEYSDDECTDQHTDYTYAEDEYDTDTDDATVSTVSTQMAAVPLRQDRHRHRRERRAAPPAFRHLDLDCRRPLGVCQGHRVGLPRP